MMARGTMIVRKTNLQDLIQMLRFKPKGPKKIWGLRNGGGIYSFEGWSMG